MAGQLTYNLPGIYSFVCPPDVTSVSVVCVGGGGQGATSMGVDSNGGGGGGLGYKNNITVIPGNTYTVVVGDAGSKNFWGDGVDGGDSYFVNISTVAGFGGKGGDVYGNPGVGGTYFGDGGGNGGAGGAANSLQGGGGGAGGYSGKGGDGLSSASGSSGAGTGGAGGGGYKAGGGGVGLLGEGSSGASANSGTIGNAGSGGDDGKVPTKSFSYINNSGISSTTFVSFPPKGGAYGGGGCSAPTYGAGGHGAVRIIWGDGREFPSTNTGDVGICTITVNNFDLDNSIQQDLFIRVRDGHAYLNPILKWNFELCYPEVNLSNLDTSKYRQFSRKPRPSLSVYEKNQTLEYRDSENMTSLTLNQEVLPIDCPFNTYVKGATSGASGFVRTNQGTSYGNVLKLSDTTGTFWNNEQIEFSRPNNSKNPTRTTVTRTITKIDIVSSSMEKPEILIDDNGTRQSLDVPSNPMFVDYWTADVMSDSEKTFLQEHTKAKWNVGLATILTSWTFDEKSCAYMAPLNVPEDSSIGIVTNRALYDLNTDVFVGVGTTSLSNNEQNRWDESAYQSDNTKGWVAD
tara:strand:- start:1155 stop:2867 length:1713 start_codon:yes stop_codon:yes gene_type:complete